MFWNLLLTAGEGGGAEQQPTGCTTEQWIIYGVLAAILIAFFVWSSYSSKKRQKQEQEKISSLKNGDSVTTIGGIVGVIVDINDEENTFTLETGCGENKSYVKFDKAAIYKTAPAEDEFVKEVTEEKVEDTEKSE